MYEAVATTSRSLSEVARGYHELTKPGITLFVVISAAAGYVVNAGSSAHAGTLLLVVAATALLSGGAATLNMMAERDRDARMQRTQYRPIPAGLIDARAASFFGWSLSAVGALLALFTLPPLVLVFLLVCHISYVYWYTPLKVRTEHSTIVGAIPGAVPVLAGAAATGAMPNTAALALTGLLFTWQFPHFLAIGWLMRADYKRAGFVLLPVIDETGKRTARVSLLYAVATMGFAVLVTRALDAGALVSSVVHTASTAYMFACVPFMRMRDQARARKLFFASLIVLPVILVALMLGLVF